MNTDTVIAEARTWIGTPWHHQARVKGAGVDCVMLLAEVYEAAGIIPHVVPEYYPIDIMLHRGSESIIAWVALFADEVTEPRTADAVLFKFGYFYSHAGIVSGPNAVIHAFRAYSAVMETRMDEGELADRHRRYYRFRGAE